VLGVLFQMRLAGHVPKAWSELARSAGANKSTTVATENLIQHRLLRSEQAKKHLG